MGSLQLDITMRGLTELILLLVGLVDLGSSYTSIPDSICHEKFGLDFCNCVQICNSLGCVNWSMLPIVLLKLQLKLLALELIAPTTVMAGLTSSVRCPQGGALLPASIPSPEEDPPPSTPTTPNVPMFPQDVRDVMMSAPEEMENRISWTTDQEEAIQAAQELGMTILEVCIAVK